MICIKHIIT